MVWDTRTALLVATVAAFVGILTVAHYTYRRRRARSDPTAARKFYKRTLSQDPVTFAVMGNVLRCYSMTSDEGVLFNTFSEVSSAIRDAGLAECKLIIGIDFTASNELQGDTTFGGRELHCIDEDVENPYQQVIRIIGNTLAPFDETGTIRGFGFGDSVTKDTSVFELDPQNHFCTGFKDVLRAYNETVSRITLGGPTNFAPLIYEAIHIVRRERKYHILVIIADGQVVDEVNTRNAIVAASLWPLSIIMVGVGDGPWGMMEAFDQRLPARRFDNFHFVDFNEVSEGAEDPEYQFALHALMEIPRQYLAIKNDELLDPAWDEYSENDINSVWKDDDNLTPPSDFR